LAEGGFELAQYNVAFLLDQQYMHSPQTPLLGLSEERLAERARGMYKMTALQGNVEAELKLGDYAYWGMGMEVDMEASVAHYRAATDARSAQAMFNLAYMYAHGLGLTRDYHLAKRHYDMAAETASDAWAPVNWLSSSCVSCSGGRRKRGAALETRTSMRRRCSLPSSV